MRNKKTQLHEDLDDELDELDEEEEIFDDEDEQAFEQAFDGDFEEEDEEDQGGESEEEGELEVIYVHGPWQADDEEGEEGEERVYAERPNKSAQKREMQELQKLAARLLEFSDARLAPLGMSEKTRLAMAEGRRIKVPAARRRQVRYLAKLFLEEDTTPMQAFIDSVDGKHTATTGQFHRLERWRERLIDEGDEALSALLQEHPEADRQQLRQLIRTARQERERDKPPAASRKLFKALRELFGV